MGAADNGGELLGVFCLGGHDEDLDDFGQPLLIDSHNAKVVDPVWKLYADTIRRAGPKPVLIEWDNDVPDWATLAGEAALAAGFLELEAA